MLAWMPMSAAKSNPETQDRPVPASLLYRFSVAFPTWAGAIMAVYSILLRGSGLFKIRPR
jgi:hypothetical protein